MKVEILESEPGQFVDTPGSLRVYDAWVLGISNYFIWRCPTSRIRKLYEDHLSDDHLDVGVGTGYYLDKCGRDSMKRLALLDNNENSLDYAARRLSRFSPETFKRDVSKTLFLGCEPFDSIAVTYLLHCLPGTMETKAGIFDELINYLSEDGVLFGSTLLCEDIERPLLARLLMRKYNSKGVFSNEHDSLGELMKILSSRFRTINVEVVGCAVMFWGKGLKGR